MLNRYALVWNDLLTVANVCDWDGNLETWHPEPSMFTVQLPDDSLVGIGDVYDPQTGEFTRPDR
jgi:hypothetical protein